jgi:hypothetical protein
MPVKEQSPDTSILMDQAVIRGDTSCAAALVYHTHIVTSEILVCLINRSLHVRSFQVWELYVRGFLYPNWKLLE